MAKKKAKKKTLKQQRLNKLEKIHDNMEYDGVDINYENQRFCDRSCDEGICRCSLIISTEVEEVDLERVSQKLVLAKDRNSILHCCIERILTSERMYESDRWDVGITRGYYGEEIEGVYILDFKHVLKKLKKLITGICTNAERIRYVLQEEYGYVLPRLVNYNNAKIVEVNVADIQPTQNYYKAIIDHSIYSGRRLPYCVVEKKNSKYIIIDGHHRYASACYNNMNKVPVIVLHN